MRLVEQLGVVAVVLATTVISFKVSHMLSESRKLKEDAAKARAVIAADRAQRLKLALVTTAATLGSGFMLWIYLKTKLVTKTDQAERQTDHA